MHSSGKQEFVYHQVPSTERKTVSSDQVFNIPCNNRFQLLTDMALDSTCTQRDTGFESSGVFE